MEMSDFARRTQASENWLTHILGLCSEITTLRHSVAEAKKIIEASEEENDSLAEEANALLNANASLRRLSAALGRVTKEKGNAQQLTGACRAHCAATTKCTTILQSCFFYSI
jgi:uncharacterized protein YcbX